MATNHQNRTAPRTATGLDRNDNIAALAHSRSYSKKDLQRLAEESAQVMGISVEEAVAFAGSVHRVLAAVRASLCLLGHRAEQAIVHGTGPGSAWAQFDDLIHIVHTLGTDVERQDVDKAADLPAQPTADERASRATIATVRGAETLVALRDRLPECAEAAAA